VLARSGARLTAPSTDRAQSPPYGFRRCLHREGQNELLRRQYIRTLHIVVDEASLVLLVLDARDPAGCRSRLVEEEVRRQEAEGKRLVFVLNKIGAPHFPLALGPHFRDDLFS